MGDSKKFIDIERVIASKSPKLLKWLPGFVIRYLKNILHEEEINNFIELHKDKNSFWVGWTLWQSCVCSEVDEQT